jgi:SNF2 family DNA or RNA helicase
MTNSGTSWKVAGDALYLQRNGDRYDPTADEVFSTIIEGKAAFDHVPAGPPPNLKKLSFSRYPAALFIDVTYEPSSRGSELKCEVSAVADGHQITLRNFRSRSSDHVIIDNTWYPFPRGLMQELCALLDDAQVVNTGPVSFRTFMQLRRVSSENELVRDHTAGSIIHPGLNKEPAEDALSLFHGTLYPYQHDGWRWLTFIVRECLGGILADEMGLGKTVQLIAALAAPDRRNVAPSLIVGPGSLLENWRREFVRFAPSVSVCIHQGQYRTGLPAVLAEHDVVITSYDTVVRDGALFGMIDWKVVALDEAQAIKNPDTRRAQSVKALNRLVSIAVTGTPVENRLRDLWSIADFVLPGYLGNQEQFERTFENDPDGARSIEPFVSPILLRRRIADVARDLPDRIVIPQVLTFGALEAGEYEALRQSIIQEYSSCASLVSLVKLRMFCTHPWLLHDSDTIVRYPETFSKFQRLSEIVEEIFAIGEKVLVFTSYSQMVDILTGFVTRKYGVFSKALDGRTDISERQTVVDKFSAVEGPALLALNPRAAGTGLNLAAANHVIHYNLEWNPATEDQASARAYRRGQNKPVTIHRLYIAGTVEEAIDQRLERKRQISNTAVVGVIGKDHEYEDITRALQMTPTENSHD